MNETGKEVCPKCGLLSDCLTSSLGNGVLKPGGLILCAYCGFVQIIDDNLRRRPLTDSEIDVLKANELAWAFIRKFRESVITEKKRQAQYN